MRLLVSIDPEKKSTLPKAHKIRVTTGRVKIFWLCGSAFALLALTIPTSVASLSIRQHGDDMSISNEDILWAVRAQLAIDLNCSPGDFDSAGFVFCEAKENPGRRPFPRGERHFEMVTMGGAVIVSATSDIQPYLREQLL